MLARDTFAWLGKNVCTPFFFLRAKREEQTRDGTGEQPCETNNQNSWKSEWLPVVLLQLQVALLGLTFQIYEQNSESLELSHELKGLGFGPKDSRAKKQGT